MSTFSVVPIEVFADKRLTLEQIRVIGVLYSFKNKQSDTVFPSRDLIAARCGMHRANISSATSALEKLGWVHKKGKGGCSRATRYTLHIPETVAYSATVAHSATSGVVDQATLTVADPATRKEQSNEQSRITNASAAEKSASVSLRTWLSALKEKGEKAISPEDTIFEYADQAGISEDMLRICWLEFKARNLAESKRKKDWRAHFRNCVRSNWYRMWAFDAEGKAFLTSHGRQAKNVFGSE